MEICSWADEIEEGEGDSSTLPPPSEKAKGDTKIVTESPWMTEPRADQLAAAAAVYSSGTGTLTTLTTGIYFNFNGGFVLLYSLQPSLTDCEGVVLVDIEG